MTTADLVAALAIGVGLVGIVVPVLPGVLLILIAIVVWAAVVGSAAAWWIAGAAATILVLGSVLKYAIPGRRLKAAGVPTSTLVAGGLLGIAGFFVIPVLGLFVGFAAGVYLAELRRVGRHDAWPSAWAAIKASGLSLLIELAAGLLAASTFAVGVVLT